MASNAFFSSSSRDTLYDVTIIIPTYNRAHQLQHCLDSIYSQRCTLTIQVVVVDDGSSDNTKSLLLLQHSPYPIEYYYQPNQGVASARNKGLLHAKGEYICFLDSDDYWHPEKISIHHSFHVSNPTKKVSCSSIASVNSLNTRFSEIASQTRYRVIDISPYQLLFANPIATSTIFFHRDVVSSLLPLFSTSLTARSDWYGWLRIATTSRISLIELTLTQRLIQQSSLAHSHSTNIAKNYRNLALLFLALHSHHPQLFNRYNHRLLRDYHFLIYLLTHNVIHAKLLIRALFSPLPVMQKLRILYFLTRCISSSFRRPSCPL